MQILISEKKQRKTDLIRIYQNQKRIIDILVHFFKFKMMISMFAL